MEHNVENITMTPNRIEGKCYIPGWPGSEHTVITLAKYGSSWIVSNSIALPSNIAQAKAIKKCFDKAFEELEKLSGN